MYDAREPLIRSNDEADVPTIHHFYIRKSHRKQGVGTKMLR